jgi:small subunit ribosomal protein S4
MGFAPTRFAARQLVNHGHVSVNGKKNDIPSYRVKVGDVVALKETSKKSKLFEGISEKLGKKDIAPWLSVDAKNLSGKILNQPTAEDPVFDAKLIVEFYSR